MTSIRHKMAERCLGLKYIKTLIHILGLTIHFAKFVARKKSLTCAIFVANCINTATNA